MQYICSQIYIRTTLNFTIGLWMYISKFIDYFDKIYIINLETRKDRRAEIAVQLKKINLSLNHPKVCLFKAVKPSEAGEFPSIGARGCFLSHFDILKDAKQQQYKKVLIFEDDLDFIKHFNIQADLALQELITSDWGIFYGDYRINKLKPVGTKCTTKVNSDIEIGTTDFIAFNGEVIDSIIVYFEGILNRKGGDVLGGPMHVDGAYSWFRKNNPSFKTIIATPALGYQRSSSSDIADSTWVNNIPFTNFIRSGMRKFKK